MPEGVPSNEVSVLRSEGIHPPGGIKWGTTVIFIDLSLQTYKGGRRGIDAGMGKEPATKLAQRKEGKNSNLTGRRIKNKTASRRLPQANEEWFS